MVGWVTGRRPIPKGDCERSDIPRLLGSKRYAIPEGGGGQPAPPPTRAGRPLCKPAALALFLQHSPRRQELIGALHWGPGEPGGRGLAVEGVCGRLGRRAAVARSRPRDQVVLPPRLLLWHGRGRRAFPCPSLQPGLRPSRERESPQRRQDQGVAPRHADTPIAWRQRQESRGTRRGRRAVNPCLPLHPEAWLALCLQGAAPPDARRSGVAEGRASLPLLQKVPEGSDEGAGRVVGDFPREQEEERAGSIWRAVRGLSGAAIRLDV
mmetsp:Transcript_8922/g.23348  ORF Transcript_8922/g.23348 Transcript_8922/m.23348 type:complete len:266 (+) Transcript_8922:222-1019(+)